MHLSSAELQTAKDDWQAHFNEWDNHEDFLERDLPRWQFPAPSAADDGGAAEKRR